MDGSTEPKKKGTRPKRISVKKSGKASKKLESPVVPKYRPRMVPLRLMIGGAIVKDTGPVTRQGYTFHAGEVTYVDERDYPHLLARRTKSPKACCGRSPSDPQHYYGVA